MARPASPLLAAALLGAALAGCGQEKTCPADQKLCGGACTAVLTDAASCGACGVSCGPGGVCSNGACTCGPTAVSCGPACAVLASDPADCGACGVACAPSQVCSTSGGVTSCAASCAPGLADCDRACVDLSSDFFDCGACGRACGTNERCSAGACVADLYVACYATDEVREATSGLAAAGTPLAVQSGPISLAWLGSGGTVALYASNDLTGSLSAIRLDPPRVARTIPFAVGVVGPDPEFVKAHGGLLYVANSGVNTLVVVDPSLGEVIDEVPLGANADPLAFDFVGDVAWVPLHGSATTGLGGQSVVPVDFSTIGTCGPLAACASDADCGSGGTCASGYCQRPPCGQVGAPVDLTALADAPGLPFPTRAVAVGAKVYVTLANLKQSGGYWTAPAGDGKLAVVDTANGDALSAVDLGPGCQDPGGLAASGTTLFVACGAGASGAPPGPVVPVDASVQTPAVKPPIVTGVSPGNVVVCGTQGFVTDQWSGSVVGFDATLASSATSSAAVCPVSATAGYAWAADVACGP